MTTANDMPVTEQQTIGRTDAVGPQKFPTPDRDQVRLAFESGSYPYGRRLGTQAYEGAEPWVRRTSVGRDGALPHQRLERALLDSLRESRGEHAYRSRPDVWVSLDDLLAHAPGLPDHEQVLSAAEIVDFDRETLLEEIERTHQPLVRGLAPLAGRLPVTGA